jgi:C1A family cysteine protease
MKKILAIIFIGILILSGSGIFGTAQSAEKNCDCKAFVRTEDFSSYEYFVMDEPLYIHDSIVFDTSEHLIINTPDEFSWKNFEGKDWTTPAKSQGNCGSCWDFAAIGTLESIVKIREDNPDLSIDLSEQYVLSCLPAAANYYGQGCLGGTPYGAFYYMMDTGPEGNNANGAIPETCFPYQASHSVPCSEKCENWESLLVPVLDCSESYLGFDSPENRAIIKSLIYEGGPIAAALNVTQDFINFFNIHHDPNDYFPDPHEPWGNMLNHIIVILGWKNDSSITNGGYWICKNSWGTSWGYDGFFNIEYGALFNGFYISTVDYDPEGNNLPPTVPTINGPNKGIPGNEYTYTLTSEDPDDAGELYYYVEWDDDTNSGWFGPFESGEPATVNHSWSSLGKYVVKAKAKDASDAESDWGTLTITIPRSKVFSFSVTFLKFLQVHPYIFPLLQKILGL